MRLVNEGRDNGCQVCYFTQSYKPQAVCACENIFNDVTMMSFYCHSQWALVAVRSGELGTYMYPM